MALMRPPTSRETNRRPITLLVAAAGLCLAALLMLPRHFAARSPAASSEAQDQNGSNSAALTPNANAPAAAVSVEPRPAQSALAQAQEQPRAVLDPELIDLAERDPEAASCRLGDLPAPLRPEFAALIASAWGKREPELAAAWARDQLDGEPRNQALLSLSADWAAANPSAAADCALAVLPESEQGQFLRTVGMQWAKQDATTALAWAAQLPDGLARFSFLAGLSSTLAETSPFEAAQLLVDFGSSPLARETALTVAIEWSRHDPEAAAGWVSLFPAGRLREQALWNLVPLWAEQSTDSVPRALLAWPEGPERDQAIRHYLDEIFEAQPARGVALLPAISDPELRQEETQRLAQHWLMRDPTAANLYLPGGR